MSDYVRILQQISRTYDFEDVMEVEREWYEEFIAKNPNATPREIWNAGYDEGYEYETERSECNYDDVIHETWIEE